jgi:hypothetical protein
VSVYGDTGATRAGMQSPAAMVAAPNQGGGEAPFSVTVPGSTVTVQLNKMKLREADMLTMLRHNTLLNAGLTKMGLRSIVNDGVPPTLIRVRDLFPDASSEELVDNWESAMIQYQRENAKLFDVIYDTINNDFIVPIMDGLAGLFSQEPAEEPLSQQELLDAIASQTAEQLLQFQTPQVSRREETPALVTITPRSASGAATPVPSTSLNMLRASAAAESGGGNGTDGTEDNEPRSSTSRARSSTQDAQKSEMELLMEGDALRAAGFAKIAKTTRVKAEKALKAGGMVNFAKTTLLRTKYGILLLIKFLSKFSPMQLSLGTLIAYYMLWPNLKPKLREILKKLYSHALAAGFTMRAMHC